MTLNIRKDWLIKIEVPQKTINLFNQYVDTTVSNVDPIDLNEKSTRGNLSKQYDLKSSNIELFNKVIIPILEDHFKNFTFTNVDAWTVYGEEYGYHKIHKHNLMETNPFFLTGDGNFIALDTSVPIDDISTVTYLKVPKPNFNFFGDVFFVLRNLKNNLEVFNIAPKVGDIFIFPCHLFHGTTPQPKGTRQTLNLDYRPILKKQ